MKYFSLPLVLSLLHLHPVVGVQGLRKRKSDSSKESARPQGRELSDGKYFDRFLTIWLENVDYKVTIADDYFEYLATQGALFSNFRAVGRPSYPNYIAMIAGSTFGIDKNDQITLQERGLHDLLENRGLTWKNYAEDYPGNCYLNDGKGAYVRRHVPFLSFSSVQDDSQRCNNVVNGDEFETDWKNKELPNFSLYVPNQDNNAHDTSIGYASDWLKSFLDPLLSDSDRMDGTMIQVVFDEPSKDVMSNLHVYSIFLGPMVKKGLVVDKVYNHYDVLKTVQENFNTGSLGQEDESATAISGIWA